MSPTTTSHRAKARRQLTCRNRHITFRTGPPAIGNRNLEQNRLSAEQLHYAHRTWYLYCPTDEGRSPCFPSHAESYLTKSTQHMEIMSHPSFTVQLGGANANEMIPRVCNRRSN